MTLLRVVCFKALPLVAFILAGCAQKGAETALHSAAPISDERPNIVLIVFEDMSSRIGAFGDPMATTPVLDALAEESVLFPNTFTTAGICAPSRSSLITGVHQQTLGTMHMRTRGASGLSGGGPVEYDAVPPPDVKAFPEYLRALGYHTSNNGKTDYQFGDPFTVWDHNSLTDPEWWSGREEGQPFFAMINLYESHESFLWPTDREPRNPVEAAVRQRNLQVFGDRKSGTDPAAVEVPPYLPDTPVVRADIARQYDNIAVAEQHVRRVMEALEEEGLLNETVIIVTTDHGDGLPRAKRSLYDSGLQVPMMVRYPDGRMGGTVVEDLVSFVDMAPSILELAGTEPPDYMKGAPIFTPEPDSDRAYVHATLDRIDAFPERQKAVRDARYKYIRNYLPDQAYFQPVAFRNSLPTMEEIWRLHGTGSLTQAQTFYHSAPRPRHELYDLELDPHEVNNVAQDPGYADALSRLSSEMDRWIAETGDLSAMSEVAMIETMWPGLEQPVTSAPKAALIEDGRLALSSPTQGASIGYRRAREESWRLYTAPLPSDEWLPIEVKAQRYGYMESDTVTVEPGFDAP